MIGIIAGSAVGMFGLVTLIIVAVFTLNKKKKNKQLKKRKKGKKIASHSLLSSNDLDDSVRDCSKNAQSSYRVAHKLSNRKL